MKKLTTIDLFAGIGGVRKGFELAGFETLFANDYEPQCKHTYDLNFSDTPLTIADISKLKISDFPEKFDALLGGFPCQPFSIAGYRKGFEDDGRGNLFFVILKIIKEKKPNIVFLENVKNLKTHDNGNTYRVIEEALNDSGYHVKSAVLNSMEYGNVPQNRERIYIIGFKSKSAFNKFSFPKKIPLKKKISDILEGDVSDKYYYNNKPLYEKLKNDVVNINTIYQWRRIYVRENKSGVCPTLTANMGTGGHNVPIIKDKKGIRKLTPHECARFQGYDDIVLPNISDSSLYKQMGNSVTVPVIKRIALQIKKACG